MTEEKSLGYESGKRCLVNRGRVLIYHAPDLCNRIDQLLWSNDVAQTQRGIKNLTHGSRVDDSPGIIEPLQTWQRGASKAELGVVIILENKSVVVAGKIDQSSPSPETHRDSEWKLMGRRRVNDSRQPLFGDAAKAP